jgi:hypothetical protein
VSILRFDIRYPNGHREAAVIEGERALIGSASYADVRLPVDQAAYEHIVIEAIGQTVRAQAKADHPPATVNGMPLTSSPILPDTVLGVGSIQIFVSLGAGEVERPGAGGQGAKKKKKEGSPIIRIVGLIALPALGYIVLADNVAPIPAAPAGAPALFSSAAAPCPEAAPQAALALANEKRDLAEGKRERHPFAPSEGVAAVDLYRVAASCFRVANTENQAKEVEQTAHQLTDTITADFRARRLRLEHMLAVQDYELVRRDVNTLMALTAGKQGPYVAWLSTVSEDLKRRGQ